MKLPYLNQTGQSVQTLDCFSGLNQGPVPGDTEFSVLKNMTSEHYPALAVRGRRKWEKTVSRIAEDGTEVHKDILGFLGMQESAALVLREESETGSFGRLYYGEEGFYGEVASLSDTEKQMVRMGAFVCIFPDKFYFNTTNLEEKGSMEASFTFSDAQVQEGHANMAIIQDCRQDGTGNFFFYVSKTPPDNPEAFKGNNYWADVSEADKGNCVAKQYDNVLHMWFAKTLYLKLIWEGIGKSFAVGDTVEIENFVPVWMAREEYTQELIGGKHTVVYLEDDFLVLTADRPLLGAESLYEDEKNKDLTVRRRVPDIDFAIECGNRLWGCRYGYGEDGRMVNEIYASSQGDFKKWFSYDGNSMDSYAVSLGSEGPFTGAVVYQGFPIFFKENSIHKIYGSTPASYQLDTEVCRGVQKGSWDSLAVVNEVLYYKSGRDICAYDGSQPQGISGRLKGRYKNAVSGVSGKRYYISMENEETGMRELFAYDTEMGLWHEEDDPGIERMQQVGDVLYFIGRTKLWSPEGVFENVMKKFGPVLQATGRMEEAVAWEAVTGPVGYAYPDKKYISRINIRVQLETGTVFRAYLEYDSSGRFEYVGEIKGVGTKSFLLPVRPRRCDHFRLKLAGKGGCRIFSITKIFEMGSDF